MLCELEEGGGYVREGAEISLYIYLYEDVDVFEGEKAGFFCMFLHAYDIKGK